MLISHNEKNVPWIFYISWVQSLALSHGSQVETSLYVQTPGGINLALHSWVLLWRKLEETAPQEGCSHTSWRTQDLGSEFTAADLGVGGAGKWHAPSAHSWAFGQEDEGNVEILRPTPCMCVCLVGFQAPWSLNQFQVWRCQGHGRQSWNG